MQSRLRSAFNLFLFLLSLVLPGAAAGFMLSPFSPVWIGAAMGVALVLLTVFILGLCAERWMIRLHPLVSGNRSDLQLGLERSLRRIYESRPFGRTPSHPPRIILTVKVEPEVLAVRSWFSPGALLISQGALGLLTEEKLRLILDGGLQRLRSPGIVLQTQSSLLLVAVMRLSPSGRVRVDQLTPFSILIYLLMQPLVVYLTYLGNQRAQNLFSSCLSRSRAVNP